MEEEYREEVIKAINDLLADENSLKAFVSEKFGEYDDNSSKFIEKAELEQTTKDMYSDIGLPEPTQEQIEQSLANFDVDKNGKLDSKEFLNYCKFHFQKIVDKGQNK